MTEKFIIAALAADTNSPKIRGAPQLSCEFDWKIHLHPMSEFLVPLITSWRKPTSFKWETQNFDTTLVPLTALKDPVNGEVFSRKRKFHGSEKKRQVIPSGIVRCAECAAVVVSNANNSAKTWTQMSLEISMSVEKQKLNREIRRCATPAWMNRWQQVHKIHAYMSVIRYT